MSKQAFLNAADLLPERTPFRLPSNPDREYVFKPFSIRYRLWLQKTFTKEEIQVGFGELTGQPNISFVTRVAFEILEDRFGAKDYEEFSEQLMNDADVLVLVQAMLGSIGMSEPVIEAAEARQGKQKPQSKKASRKK